MKKIIEKIKELLLSVPASCLWLAILSMLLTAVFAITLRTKIDDMWPMVPVLTVGIIVASIRSFRDKKVNIWDLLSYGLGALLIQILYWLA